MRNPDYKPRAEPVSRLAGGKRALVDRIEWHAMPDHLQAINALLAGEIDFIEAPPFDLHPPARARPQCPAHDAEPGRQPEHLSHQPSAQAVRQSAVRHALWYAFNQEDFLKAVVGDPAKYKVCKTLFICGTTYASDKGTAGRLESNFDKARALLKEAGYDGTPVVLLQSSDLFWQTNLAPVAKRLMEQAGFKVDMQPMDWQSIVIRTRQEEPARAGGWHAYPVSPSAMGLVNPVRTASSTLPATRRFNGWPCDPEMEKLRDRFARETDPAKLKEIAEAAQLRAFEWTPYVHLGEWRLVSAARKNVTASSRPAPPYSGTSRRSERGGRGFPQFPLVRWSPGAGPSNRGPFGTGRGFRTFRYPFGASASLLILSPADSHRHPDGGGRDRGEDCRALLK